MKSSRPPEKKAFRKGQVLFKEGDAADHHYLIQSGAVNLTETHGPHSYAMPVASTKQLIGEEALTGAKEHRFTATAANNEVTVVPIPAALAQELLQPLPPLVKAFYLGIREKTRRLTVELADGIMADGPVPYPDREIIKAFGVIYHVAKHTATTKNGKITVNWDAFRKYCLRVFLESPIRLELSLNVLVRMGLVTLQKVKSDDDPEGPEVLGFVHFTELTPLRDFIAWYSSDRPFANEWNEKLLAELQAENEKALVVPKTEES